MFRVGITGGMGCGKSTVARLMEARGFRRLDSDAIVRDRVLREPAVKAAIRERFGAGVLAANGEVERAHLAERVFADDDALRWLEDLVTPASIRRGRRPSRPVTPRCVGRWRCRSCSSAAWKKGLISRCAWRFLRISSWPGWKSAESRERSPGGESPSNCRWRKRSNGRITCFGTGDRPRSLRRRWTASSGSFRRPETNPAPPRLKDECRAGLPLPSLRHAPSLRRRLQAVPRT